MKSNKNYELCPASAASYFSLLPLNCSIFFFFVFNLHFSWSWWLLIPISNPIWPLKSARSPPVQSLVLTAIFPALFSIGIAFSEYVFSPHFLMDFCLCSLFLLLMDDSHRSNKTPESILFVGDILSLVSFAFLSLPRSLFCFVLFSWGMCFGFAALQLHPDKNAHPKAEIAFKLVSEVRFDSIHFLGNTNFCYICLFGSTFLFPWRSITVNLAFDFHNNHVLLMNLDDYECYLEISSRLRNVNEGLFVFVGLRLFNW